MLDEKVKALVAIGASITSNCQPCLDYHMAHARKTGADSDEIVAAIEIGKQVRRGATAIMDQKIDEMAAMPADGRVESACGCR